MKFLFCLTALLFITLPLAARAVELQSQPVAFQIPQSPTLEADSPFELIRYRRREYCVLCGPSERPKKCAVKAWSGETGRVMCGVANPGCQIVGYSPEKCGG
jgi:hypothetical protein